MSRPPTPRATPAGAADATDPVARAAIRWMVLLRSGRAGARRLSGFQRWRDADPAHDAACRRIERVLGRIAVCVADPAARLALRQPARRPPPTLD